MLLLRFKILLLLFISVFSGSAIAAEFYVDNILNTGDRDTADGLCNTSSQPLGSCSLRAAIQQANANDEDDIITLSMYRSPAHNATTTYIEYGLDSSISDDLNSTEGDFDILKGKITIRGVGLEKSYIVPARKPTTR